MPANEYEVVSQSDDEIVVRDAATGHLFTFTVRSDVLNNRLLSRARFVASDRSDVRAEDIVVFVWAYAQRVMLKAGKIDQVIVG